jgi:hypothetical protein
MRGAKGVPPFKLPADVTDKHELVWWRIINDADYMVVKRRAVFHVRTRWDDFKNEYNGAFGSGADFDLQWALYEGDSPTCIGRASAWNCWAKNDWSECFDNETEARRVAALRASEHALRLRGESERFDRIAAAHLEGKDCRW